MGSRRWSPPGVDPGQVSPRRPRMQRGWKGGELRCLEELGGIWCFFWDPSSRTALRTFWNGGTGFLVRLPRPGRNRTRMGLLSGGFQVDPPASFKYGLGRSRGTESSTPHGPIIRFPPRPRPLRAEALLTPLLPPSVFSFRPSRPSSVVALFPFVAFRGRNWVSSPRVLLVSRVTPLNRRSRASTTGTD